MERNRFSGALSLNNQLHQFIRATRILIIWSILLAIVAGGITLYHVASKIEKEAPGYMVFYSRVQSWELVNNNFELYWHLPSWVSSF